MVTSWEKYIKKHPLRDELKRITEQLTQGDLAGIDVKPLSGYKGKFRARKGKIRIIFSRVDGEVAIEAVDSRGDVYKNL